MAQQAILLSTGRIVIEKPYGNGAMQAVILNDEESGMTEQEWEEYVTHCKQR